jgi:uncharacterized membrane protein
VDFRGLIALAANLFEGAGVAVMVAGAVLALVRAGLSWGKKEGRESAVQRFRHGLGQAILLGLELLVAADIIRTVSEEPSLRGVVILGLIVLIRTFLSFTLLVELEGRWPWQRGRGE